MTHLPYVPIDWSLFHPLSPGTVVFSHGQTLDDDELSIGQRVKLDPGKGEGFCVEARVVAYDKLRGLWYYQVPQEETPAVLFIDCKCKDCVYNRQKRYYMVGGCQNCLTFPIVIAFHAGERSRQNQICPVCHVLSVRAQRLATEEEVRGARGLIDN